MRLRRTLRWTVWLFLLLWAVCASALLVDREPKDNRSVSERIVSTAKKSGQRIEQEVTSVGKQIEDTHLGEKVMLELKRAGTKTAEGFTQAGDNISQTFQQLVSQTPTTP